jgi:NAD(P)H dehydrogenase (quinone)
VKALIVFAHPEAQSFNGSLLKVAANTLSDEGYEVAVSDLYAMGFNPVAGPHDVQTCNNPDVFNLGLEQMHAAGAGTLAADIQVELEKLLAADLLILQFPMWWFSMPAILKGWLDRVLVFGAAYDFGRTWDNGVFKGKRAMLAFTASAPEAAFAPDGRNGDMERVLWPIHAGVLALCGYSVLPPFIAHGIPFVGDEVMNSELERYRLHLQGLDRLAPLYFHPDSDIDKYRLKPEVEPATPGQHRDERKHLT